MDQHHKGTPAAAPSRPRHAASHMRSSAAQEDPRLGIAATVLGAASFALGQFVHWLPALIAAVAAIVCGIIALKRRERLRGLGVAGILLGLAIVIFYAVTIGIIVYHYGQLASLIQ